MEKRVISIVNQKGGVGKTTTAVNLATALSAVDKKVLLIDFDPQGNASSSLGFEQAKRQKTIYDVMTDLTPIRSSILQTNFALLDLISADVNLLAAEIELVHLRDREYILRNKIRQIIDNYDYVIIDCPPTLGLLAINALTASNEVIIPMQCEFLALEGLSHLLQTIELIKNRFNSELKILGVLLTMYDKRNKLTEAVADDVRDCLGELVFQNCIPRNVKLSEAPSHGQPAIIYDHRCSGSIAYLHLAREILDKGRI